MEDNVSDKSEQSSKTAAIKESITQRKTKVLLLRDLPFITRLSKFYDLTLFNGHLSNKSSNSIDNKTKPIPNLLEKENKDRYQNLNQFNDVGANEALKIISGNKLRKDSTKPNKYNNIDDPILEEMQRQSQA